jgi:PAS domain S-box-containing protein
MSARGTAPRGSEHDGAGPDALLLDAATRRGLERLAKLSASLLHCPSAVIALLDEQCLSVVSGFGLSEQWIPQRKLPLSSRFARLVLRTGGSLALENAAEDSTLVNDCEEPRLGAAILGRSLRDHEGSCLGTLCVIDEKPRQWTSDETLLLARLAELGTDLLELWSAKEQVQHKFASLAPTTERLSLLVQQQKTILDNVHDSIIVSDFHGTVSYWSPGATTIFGYSAKEMLGQNLSRLYPQQDPEVLAVDLTKIIQGEDYVGLWRGIRKDGSSVWLDIRTTVMRDDQDAPVGLIGLAKDITDKKLAEDEVRREQQLAAIISHDLRTPLNAVLMGAHGLLYQGELNPLQRSVLERVRS